MLLRCYDGRIVSILEGGYDLNAFKESIEAHVGALLEFNWKFKKNYEKTWWETYLVTETGNERLGKQKLDLVIL